MGNSSEGFEDEAVLLAAHARICGDFHLDHPLFVKKLILAQRIVSRFAAESV